MLITFAAPIHFLRPYPPLIVAILTALPILIPFWLLPLPLSLSHSLIPCSLSLPLRRPLFFKFNPPSRFAPALSHTFPAPSSSKFVNPSSSPSALCRSLQHRSLPRWLRREGHAHSPLMLFLRPKVKTIFGDK
jgi:hypothetical protein